MGGWEAIWAAAGTPFPGCSLGLAPGLAPGRPCPPAAVPRCTLPPTELGRQVSLLALPCPLPSLGLSKGANPAPALGQASLTDSLFITITKALSFLGPQDATKNQVSLQQLYLENLLSQLSRGPALWEDSLSQCIAGPGEFPSYPIYYSEKSW